MKIKFSFVIPFILVLLVIVSLALAASFESRVNLNRTDAGLVNIFLNFTVSNNETATTNITQVNITLPSMLTFVTGYNGSVGNFTPTSFSYDTTARNATWTNTTPTGFINRTDTAYFWFNVTINKTAAGNYSINVSTLDTSNGFNSTNVTIFVERTIWSSPLEQFYVKPVEILLNWTNGYRNNITLTVNQTLYNIALKIWNETIGTSMFIENYTQGNSQDPCQNLRLLVQNITEAGNYVGLLNATTGQNAMNVSLIINTETLSTYQCLPGRYRIGNFTITNATQTNESANISVILDIPISANNTFNNLTGTGSFAGSLLTNAIYYHSYYFNTSLLTNVTGATINLSWPSSAQDIDVFLFDNSGNLRAKSINKNGTTERLYYNFLNYSSPAFWEMRVYGNSSFTISYKGNIFFTTLNATNVTHPVYSINFGVLNVTSNSTQNITLKNEGNLSLSNVAESKEIYHVRRFNGNGTGNFTFLVPDSSIATKIKVSLNWTGASNYSFSIYNPSNVLVGNSANKYMYANKTGAAQEEYNETSSIGSSLGLWRIEVRNDTRFNLTDPYNLTVYTYVSASTWLSTNYTATTFPNSTYNSTTNVSVNFTNGIPATAMDGTYEGYLQYLDANRVGINIPIQVNVSTPMLVVNDTLSSSTARVDENYGANLTRILYLNISNPGTFNLDINFTSSGNLTYGGYNATLAHNITQNAITTIPANGYKIVQVNMTFNSSMPIATYSGWIFFNGTNQNATWSAHPYQTYNLSLTLNLTRLLDVRILQLISSNGDTEVYNGTDFSAENLTERIRINYINGTEITDNSLLPSNFSVWLVETNVSHTIPSSGSLTLYNGTTPVYCPSGCLGGSYPSNFYYINSTIPANQPGGRYAVHVRASRTNGSFAFEGEGTNSSLVINNTGLHMSTTNATSITLTNGTYYPFYVNVSNYGPLAASSATIQLSESCGWGIEYVVGQLTCYTITTYGPTLTFSLPAYNTNCLVMWRISAGSSAVSACTGNVIGDSTTNKWFNPNGINLTITVTGVSGDGGAGAATTTTTLATTTTTTTTTIPPTQQQTANISRITPDSPAIINITNPETLKIQKMIVAVKNTVSNVSITVKEGSIPTGAAAIVKPEEGAILKYLEFVPSNITDADVANVTISFQVEKSWVTTNSIDAATIALYRYSNSTWNKLQTSKINETSDKYYFRAISPGLSVFAIAGEKIKGFPWLVVVVIATVAVAAVLAYLFWPVEEKKAALPFQLPQKEETRKEEAKNPWDELRKKWEELTKKKS